MTTQAPVKHPGPPALKHDEPRKVVGQPEGAPLMPLAEPAPGSAPIPQIDAYGEPFEDGERLPGTMAEEQRRRSAEYEASLVAENPASKRVEPVKHDNHASKK